MRRNTAGQIVTAQLNALADGTPVVSGTTTITVIKDGVGAAGVGTISHVNGGLWKYLPTQAETDAEHLTFVFTNSLAATQSPQMYTEVDVNILKINSDTLPVNNLEKQYNTVGLIGDTFPSTQAQLSSIVTGSAGISTLCETSVLTIGTETNTFTSTFALDGIYHTVTNVASNIDFYYEFDLGKTGVGSTITWDGYAQLNGDTVNVFGWDWISSGWVQVGTILGGNTTTPINEVFIVSTGMTGDGSNVGKLRIRFESSTAINIATDRILCSYSVIPETPFILHTGTAQAGSTNTITLDIGSSVFDGSYINSRIVTTSGTGAEQENIITDYNGTTKIATVKNPWVTIPDATTNFVVSPAQVHAATTSGGYDDGAVYVDVSTGSAGTQIGVNGTSDNPSSNLADARTIANAINVQKFKFDRGLTSTALDQDYIGWRFDVRSVGLFDLNNRDISGTVFSRAFLTGSCTASSTVVFEVCGFIDTSLPRCNLIQCGFNNTITLNQTLKYMGTQCFENSSGLPPTFNIAGDGITKTELVLEFTGRLTVTGMTSVDVVTITGDCEVTLGAGNTGGTLNIYGDIPLTDLSGGSVTIGKGNVKHIRDTVDNLNDFDPTLDTVAHVTLVDTCTTNTDFIAPDNAGITANGNAIAALNNVSTAQIQTLLDGLNDLTAAQVKAEIVAALTSDLTSEPTTFPSDTAPLSEKLGYLFAVAGNKITQTSTTQTIRNRADTLSISTAPVSSDGTTTTRGAHS